MNYEQSTRTKGWAYVRDGNKGGTFRPVAIQVVDKRQNRGGRRRSRSKRNRPFAPAYQRDLLYSELLDLISGWRTFWDRLKLVVITFVAAFTVFYHLATLNIVQP